MPAAIGHSPSGDERPTGFDASTGDVPADHTAAFDPATGHVATHDSPATASGDDHATHHATSGDDHTSPRTAAVDRHPPTDPIGRITWASSAIMAA